jgi:MYXO-CTERM domain-containing protein
VVQVAEDAFGAWAAAQRAGEAAPCIDLSLPLGGVTTDTQAGYTSSGTNANLVVFRRGFCSAVPIPTSDPCWAADTCANLYGCWPDASAADRTTLALTTVTYDTRSGEILDADIEVVGWDGEPGPTAGQAHGWYYTCGPGSPPLTTCRNYGDADCAYMDLQSVITHEAGHVLGLNHTSVRTATMFASAGLGETIKRTLAPDDVDGICSVYPAGAATPACASAPLATGGGGGCGCGTAGADGLGLALLGLVVARRRRRVLPSGG